MTYLLFTLWIISLLLVAGELDGLISRSLMSRLRVTMPDVHWGVAFIGSAAVPGLGQFVNGQPIKAAFVFAWPFLTMFGAPIPRPWQLLGLKTMAYLLPWYVLQVLDALIVGELAEIRHRRSSGGTAAPIEGAKRAAAMADYLARRKDR